MLRALDYPVNGRPISMQQIVGAVFVLALRTGMRAGEITGLEWARVHGRWVTLAETKSGTARDVPLSARAARLIELDPKYVDVIVRRWEEFTGKQATREADGAVLDQAASDSSTISQ